MAEKWQKDGRLFLYKSVMIVLCDINKIPEETTWFLYCKSTLLSIKKAFTR